MNWIRVGIEACAEGIEPLTGRLLQMGITGFEIEDERDFEHLLEENSRSPEIVSGRLIKEKQGKTRVIFYLSENEAGMETLALVNSMVDEMHAADEGHAFGSLKVETDTVDEEDWANNWKKYFKPIPVGDNILIVPEWEKNVEPDGRTVFTVNPGMAFGTGSHETTRMCICQLEKYVFPGCSVLDIGCGSGILSLISLLLGASRATAVDIDPNCESIVHHNAAANGIEREKYAVFTGDILSNGRLRGALPKCDIVVANIVADVIIRLAGDVKSYLNPNGVFICSGIIDFKKDDVLRALKSAGFEITSEAAEGEWAAISGRYKENSIC